MRRTSWAWSIATSSRTTSRLVDTPDGEMVKVLDFGIAKVKEARMGEDAGLTLDGRRSGDRDAAIHVSRTGHGQARR